MNENGIANVTKHIQVRKLKRSSSAVGKNAQTLTCKINANKI